MTRNSWLLIVPLALAAVTSAPLACVEFDTFTLAPQGGSGGMAGNDMGGGGTGGMSSSSSSGAGGSAECTEAMDCPMTQCIESNTCDNGVCKPKFVPNNEIPINSQVYGDCSNVTCDGNGGTGDTPTDGIKDAYDWGTSNPCYKSSCKGYLNPVANEGASCTTAWGNPTGICTLQFKCIECTNDTECVSGTVCREGRCIADTCENAMQDGSETDLNCGGPNCFACSATKMCNADSDCEGKCNKDTTPATCLAPSCADGIKDGDETDVDCGGSSLCGKENPIKKCPADAHCLIPDDCDSGSCVQGTCLAPSCTDHIKNGTETSVDCGGDCTAPCPP